MSESCRFRQRERYGACDYVQGLGKALPNKIPTQDQIEHNASRFCCCSHFAVINARPLVLADKTPRAYAKFGPAVESCFKNYCLC